MVEVSEAYNRAILSWESLLVTSSHAFLLESAQLVAPSGKRSANIARRQINLQPDPPKLADHIVIRRAVMPVAVVVRALGRRLYEVGEAV